MHSTNHFSYRHHSLIYFQQSHNLWNHITL